jgi:hypothetical protein
MVPVGRIRDDERDQWEIEDGSSPRTASADLPTAG